MLEQPPHAIGRGSFGDTVHVQRLGDREPDREARVQRRERILEHHLDFAPQRAHLIGRQARDVAPGQLDAAAVDVDQPQQRASGGRLAATGFPDQRQRFAGTQIEADLLDRVDAAAHASEQARPDREARLQAADLEQRLAGRGRAQRRGRGPRRSLSRGRNGKARRRIAALHRTQSRHRGQQRARIRMARRTRRSARTAHPRRFRRGT